MSKNSSNNVVGFLSMIAIVACAACLILSYVLPGKIPGFVSIISYFALLFSAVIASWNYIKKCSLVLKIIYYVSVILVIVFLVL